MVTLEIPDTLAIVRPADARKFCDEHVIVKKADLERVKKLCEEKGCLEELKALGVMVHELSPREGEGDW